MRTARTLCQCAICALPMLLGLIYIPSLDAPFSAPKTALLIIAAVGLFACVAASGWLRSLRLAVAALSADNVRILFVFAIGYCVAVVASWIASPRTDMGGLAVAFVLAGPLLWAAAATAIGGVQTRFLLGIALAGAVQCAIALAQWGFGLDLFSPFGGSAGVAGRMQIYGSLGNPDFVAVFIAATMPAAVTLACDVSSKRVTRWIWAATIVAEFVAIFGAGCRTGLFAGVTGVAAILILRASPGQRELRRRIGIAAVIMLLIGAAALGFARRSPITAQDAVRGRVFIWQAALSQGNWRTLLGSGPGTFAYGYPARVGPAYLHSRVAGLARYIGYERTAVNDFLQALVETGWLGLLALAATIAWWLRIVWDRIKPSSHATFVSPKTPARTLAAFSGVLVLLVAALLESPFQHAETWALLWLWMSLPVAVESSSSAAQSQPARTTPAVLVLRWSAAVVFMVATAYAAVQPVIGSYWIAVGERWEDRHRYSEAAATYQRALEHDFSSGNAHFNLVRSLALGGDLDGGWRASNEALRWVNEPEVYLMRAYIREDQNDYPGAVHELATALQIFPFSSKLQAALAVAAEHGARPATKPD